MKKRISIRYKGKIEKTKGVSISFKGMSLKKRISVWWTFTLGCLFSRNVKTEEKVTSITI